MTCCGPLTFKNYLIQAKPPMVRPLFFEYKMTPDLYQMSNMAQRSSIYQNNYDEENLMPQVFSIDYY